MSALSYTVAGAQLQDVRVAGYAALDVLYVAVRDDGWSTVPGEVLSCQTRPTQTGTTTTVEVRHRRGHIAFRWRGSIEATADRIRFAMEGVAERCFEANRIGFCLLHPQSLKDQQVRVSGPGGAVTWKFPAFISPAPVFTGFDQMTCRVGDGAELEIRLSGQLFETEDHRNWSDPGWKTYCPPLGTARPVRFLPGQRVRQSVELRARVRADAPRRAPDSDLAVIRIGTAAVGTVPAIGLGVSGRPAAANAARDAVLALHPSSLHAEIEDREGWDSQLETAAAEAADLGVPLDVAVVAAPDRVATIAGRVARTVPRLGRMSVFSPTSHGTDGGTVQAVRAALRDAGRTVPVGGGSRAHFAELNRGDFDIGSWDFVTYGLTPQVHHTDDDSILATEAAIADSLGQAGTIAGGLPVVVGPITLRPRFSAAADRPGPRPADDEDGPDVDERQHGQLAGVYLAAAAARLIGADALTVFRATGSRGVVTGSGQPTAAAAVVSVLTGLTGAQVRASQCLSSGIVPLAVGIPGRLHILVTNLGQERRRLELEGAAAREAVVLAGGEPAAPDLDPARLTLPPRSVVLISAAMP